MRNYIKYIFSAILIAIAASGCTRNDGDIGPWFGQWKLVALTCDDAPVADYGDNIFFSFQNNVFQIITVKGEFDEAICWANWTAGALASPSTLPTARAAPAPSLLHLLPCRPRG